MGKGFECKPFIWKAIPGSTGRKDEGIEEESRRKPGSYYYSKLGFNLPRELWEHKTCLILPTKGLHSYASLYLKTASREINSLA